MKLNREWVEELIFGEDTARRFTQDSPVLPDVWLEYAQRPGERVDLLLTPYRDVRPGDLSRVLTKRLGETRRAARVAYNQSAVVASLTFEELIQVVVPRSQWWHRYIVRKYPGDEGLQTLERLLEDLSRRSDLATVFQRPGAVKADLQVSGELLWMLRIGGTIARGLAHELPKTRRSTDLQRYQAWRKICDDPAATIRVVADWLPTIAREEWDGALVWSVSRNRPAISAVWRSVQTVKADAAYRLFDLSCKELTWAIIDSGIDARHWAFRKRDTSRTDHPPCAEAFVQHQQTGRWENYTRIKGTYDFTLIRHLLASDGSALDAVPNELRQRFDANPHLASELRQSLNSGREVDWGLLRKFLEIPHEDGHYQAPHSAHGTHVAGILAADWANEKNDVSEGETIRGMCPDINLYDLRVLDDEGRGDEFAVMAALQFVRYLNSHQDYIVVHGVNVSLSIRHDVANYACGRTPICEECDRLVNAGIVVVAAAGNDGYLQYMTARSVLVDGYRSISITDPGNAEGVITVGATHRYLPHTYGVSYFSSRGPTGDGRYKPDLVAPGEKIEAPAPGDDLKRMDGTSMAAPHVSGAAALLIARHRELAGNPERVKAILCKTATDLGRERYFQGAGMVDVLRALQSV